MPKPGDPLYDDESALYTVLVTLCGFDEHQVRTGCHRVVRALDHEGVLGFCEDLINLSTADLMSLIIPAHGGYAKGDGFTAPYNDPATDPCDVQAPSPVETMISKIESRKLCILVSFFQYASAKAGEPVDITEMTIEAYNIFRLSIYSAEDKIIPFGVQIKRDQDVEVANWTKVVKADYKHYKDFKDPQYWYKFREDFIVTLKSHKLGHMIDPKYVPTNKELHKNQSEWLYKVFQDNFKQASVRKHVVEHKEDLDILTMWTKIVTTMEKSMAAQIALSAMLSWLTSTVLVKSGWKGGQAAFITFFGEQARKYNELSLDPYSDRMLVQFLENTLAGTENLESVLRNLRIAREASGNLDDVSWPEYLASLTKLAQVYDIHHAKK